MPPNLGLIIFSRLLKFHVFAPNNNALVSKPLYSVNSPTNKGRTSRPHPQTYRAGDDGFHDASDLLAVRHVEGVNVRRTNEALRVGILGGQSPQRGLALEEGAVVAVEGRGQFGVEEDTPTGDGLEGGGAFIGESHPNEHFTVLKKKEEKERNFARENKFLHRRKKERNFARENKFSHRRKKEIS